MVHHVRYIPSFSGEELLFTALVCSGIGKIFLTNAAQETSLFVKENDEHFKGIKKEKKI